MHDQNYNNQIVKPCIELSDVNIILSKFDFPAPILDCKLYPVSYIL